MRRDFKARPWRRLAERPRALALLLVVVAFALYWPSLNADFVWDARSVILTNSYVHGLRNLPDVLTLRVMRLDVIDNNRPLFLVTAMLDWALWGTNPFGYHLTNNLLHALVVALLFAFARKLMAGAPPWAPFFAALLFAVHPLNCETVAEISYRKDLIVAACILGALNLAAIFQPVFSRRNVLLGGGCVVCLLLAAATKENAVAGPFALGAYWLLFRRDELRDNTRVFFRNRVSAKDQQKKRVQQHRHEVKRQAPKPRHQNVVQRLRAERRMHWCRHLHQKARYPAGL